MRLFVAVDLNPATRQAIASAQRRLGDELEEVSGLRWVRPEHLHLTLAFLGEVAAPRVDAIVSAIAAPVEGIGPFRLGFGGFGVFPPHGPPRVLWLGLSSGVREITQTHAVVADRLATLGLPREERRFHPHLTLGRWKSSRPRDRLRVAVPGGVPAGAMAELDVHEVTLYESRLSSSGAIHTVLARATLI